MLQFCRPVASSFIFYLSSVCNLLFVLCFDFFQGEEIDIYIMGTGDRNQALNGDLVVVKLNPPSKWKVSLSQMNLFW